MYEVYGERPDMQAMNERFEMRLEQETLRAIDAWRSQQPDLPGRSEAARRLISSALAAHGTADPEERVTFTPAQILQTHLLCTIVKALQPKAQEDANFIQEALYSGNAWALSRQVPGLVDARTANPETVDEVHGILLMWEFVEDGYDALSKKDRARVAEEAQPFGKDPRFEGFDGNNETEHLSVGKFMVEKMGWFPRFTNRVVNCHGQTLEMHRRLLTTFRPMRAKMAGRKLSVDQLVEILKAPVHPSQRKGKGLS